MCDCTGCHLPLDADEVANAGSPPLCSWCEEDRCSWCGEWVCPRDKALDGGGPCHKSCLMEMNSEDPGEVADDDDFHTFDLENPDDFAGVPEDDEDDLPF